MTTTWGDWIEAGSVGYPVRGERPAWLDDRDNTTYRWNTGEVSLTAAWYPHDLTREERWSKIAAIRLPADHWAYEPIKAGFTPWAGGQTAPNDWDGEWVYRRDGSTQIASQSLPHSKNWRWTHSTPRTPTIRLSDITGYKRKSDMMQSAERSVAQYGADPHAAIDFDVPVQPDFTAMGQAVRLLEAIDARFDRPNRTVPGKTMTELLNQIDHLTAHMIPAPPAQTAMWDGSTLSRAMKIVGFLMQDTDNLPPAQSVNDALGQIEALVSRLNEGRNAGYVFALGKIALAIGDATGEKVPERDWTVKELLTQITAMTGKLRDPAEWHKPDNMAQPVHVPTVQAAIARLSVPGNGVQSIRDMLQRDPIDELAEELMHVVLGPVSNWAGMTDDQRGTYRRLARHVMERDQSE